MVILRTWWAALPRLRAREALQAIRAGVIASGNLAERDARRAMRELEAEAEAEPTRQKPIDPITFAQKFGIRVVRE